LTIKAARGEHPLLIGGRRLTGWTKDGEKFWSVSIPEAVNRKWDFRLLVVNGHTCPRARYPEKGFLQHETIFDVPWMSTTGGGWKRKPTQDELTHLKYKAGELGDWLDINNAELTVYHMWDESTVGLKSIDTATRTLTFSNPAGNPPGAFGVQKYVVWNIKEGMTQPGEWYLDRTQGKLVYWPLPKEDMTKADVWAPTLETIIDIYGEKSRPAKNITLEGLSLTVTNTPLKSGGFGAGEFAGAVSVYGADHCVLKNLDIYNVAGQGINSWESDNLHILDCDLHDTGANGIKATGANIVCQNCLVHDPGILYPSAAGIWASGLKALVSHCEVYDTPYSAIIGGGDYTCYEYNLIYRAMKELHDGGGIYAGFSKGMTLRGNVVRDIVDTGGYGASAYYLDEQSQDCLVEGNLSVNVAHPTQNHMAKNNIIRNNVFIVNGDCVTTFARCQNYTLEKNIYYATGNIIFRYPADGITSMKDDLFFSKSGKVEYETLVDYAGQGLHPMTPTDGSLIADPIFMNLQKWDFRFRQDSPALKLGIETLDWKKAGRENPKN
jgi:hypothetical protein